METIKLEFDWELLKSFEEKYFAEYYIQTRDPVLSIKRAYDKVKYAHPDDQLTWQEMMDKPGVRAYIEFLETQERVDQRKIIRELANIAFSDLSDFIDERGKPKLSGNTSAVKKLIVVPTENGDKITIEMYDKLSALKSLAELIPKDKKTEIPQIIDDVINKLKNIDI